MPISIVLISISIITLQKDIIDDLVKEMKDLQIKLAKLEEKRAISEIKLALK